MRTAAIALASMALLAGCAAPPMGPMVQVMPAPNKPYAQFLDDDYQCRSAASYQVAGQAQVANNRAVGGAVLSTVVGAGLGAAIGGGRGAAVGAASGAGLGAGLGAGASAGAQGGIQAQYDNVYAQCMYSHGNQVPGMAPVGYSAYPAPAYPNQAYPTPAYAAPVRDPMVRDIQLQLRRRGYYAGPTDGVDGPETMAAIQQFQARHDMEPDGVASPYILSAIRQTPVGY